jgi:hypothetical protein
MRGLSAYAIIRQSFCNEFVRISIAANLQSGRGHAPREGQRSGWAFTFKTGPSEIHQATPQPIAPSALRREHAPFPTC